MRPEELENDNSRPGETKSPAAIYLTLATAPASPSRGNAATILLDYLKALMWPILVIVLLVVHRPPLGQIVDSIARKLQDANKLSVGPLSLEVMQQIKDPELVKKVGQLSYGAVETLMRTPRNGSMMFVSRVTGEPEFTIPDAAALQSLRELEQKKLIEFSDKNLDSFLAFIDSVADKKENDERGYVLKDKDPAKREAVEQESYRLTEAGEKAVDAITQVVAVQLTTDKKQ